MAFSISEVVKLTSLGRTAIFAEIKAGSLVARKQGRRTLILGSFEPLKEIVNRDSDDHRNNNTERNGEEGVDAKIAGENEKRVARASSSAWFAPQCTTRPRAPR